MCELFFFDHVAGGVPPESIDIHQEVYLGPDAFAEIRVKAGEAAPYYVEIKPGYSGERVLESIARKYGAGGPASAGAARLIVLADASVLANAALERALRASLRPGLELELWDEQRLFDAIDKRFGLRLDALREQDLLGLRSALDRAKGVYAFGDEFQNDSLEASLLWHLAPRQLRRLRGSGRTSPPVQGLALVGRDVISEERVEALARRRRRLARRLEPALSADVGLQENRADAYCLQGKPLFGADIGVGL